VIGSAQLVDLRYRWRRAGLQEARVVLGSRLLCALHATALLRALLEPKKLLEKVPIGALHLRFSLPRPTREAAGPT